MELEAAIGIESLAIESEIMAVDLAWRRGDLSKTLVFDGKYKNLERESDGTWGEREREWITKRQLCSSLHLYFI